MEDEPDPGSTEASTEAVDFRDALVAAGVTVVEEPLSAGSPTGLQLSTFQVENMERQIEEGGGYTGWELDELAGSPGGVPFSYVVAGWLVATPTPTAAAAAAITGDQDWEQAPRVIFPTGVLTLFVADALQASGAGEVRQAVPRAAPIAFQEQSVCERFSSWVSGVIDAVFDGLTIDTSGGGFTAWLGSFWNSAVDLVRGVVATAVETVIDVLVGPLRTALAITGTLKMVASLLQPWSLDLVASNASTRLAVGGEPDIIESFTTTVDTGVDFTWDDHPEIQGCARVAGLALPDPSKATGATVDWRVRHFPPHGAIKSSEATIGADNTATLRWQTGREESDEGDPFPGWVQGRATVVSDQVEALRDLVESWIAGKVPDGFVGEQLTRVFGALTEAVFDQLIEMVQVRSKPVTVDVISHIEVPREYPDDDLEEAGDTEGSEGPGDSGGELIEVDVAAAARTGLDLMSGGRFVEGDITGHADFTVWLAPSAPGCRIERGVSFAENDPACSFTVADGPSFLVGLVLVPADALGGGVMYTWIGTERVDEMLGAIGTELPRCLDLPWYFRIFEGGVALGYPEGLTLEHEIDRAGADCVVLAASTVSEYTTTP